MGTRERRDRSDSFDRKLSGLFLSALDASKISSKNIALAAVGGYGRGELSPGSDLDLLVIHDGVAREEQLSDFVNALLYPLWDAGLPVDHAVRTRAQTRETANEDIRVAMGILDIRALEGNSDLINAVAIDVAEDWRKNSKRNLTKLRESSLERAERSGELAFLLEPDLKEARGGLRDINALRAIAFSGEEVALDRLSSAEALLSNVRDVLHGVSGKGRDQLLLTEQDRVSAEMHFVDADALMLEVARAARAVDYVMDLTWHRIDSSKSRGIFKKSKPESLGKGVIALNNEVTIDSHSDILSDSGVGLRAAAIAAQRGLPLSIEACIQLADEFRPIPTPWPRSSREDLVTLIGAGSAMIRVFEALDQEGIIERWIPEWSHVRFLPQRNVLHRHTVDRHMLETAVRAAKLTRTVHRPDLLLVAALLHDIGKGFPDKDHSEYGEELMRPLALRLGFSESDSEVLALLVKQHLLLSSVATRRDLDDPATIEFVTSLIPDPEVLELLHALSIADGEATGKTAWSNWKAGLVADLVNRCIVSITGGTGIKPAEQLELSPEQLSRLDNKSLSLTITPRDDAYEIEILSPDQVGLLSAVAGTFSVLRLNVRSARTRTVGDAVAMNWIVTLDPNATLPSEGELTMTLRKSIAGEIDLAKKIDDRISNYRKAPGIPVPPPIVTATNDIATQATVLEIRMHDRPGVLYSVARAISRFGVDIRAAIVSTLGAEALDTLYVTDFAGEALTEERAKLLANQVESYLLTQY
jgi:[protein-PII] uridylyltransferase